MDAIAGRPKKTTHALNIEALPPLSSDLLEALQDEALGVWLWMTFIQTQARDLGIPATEITEEFCDRFIEHVKNLDSSTAKNAAVEKALHLAASGNFENSGKILREHVTNGADVVAWKNLGRRYVPAGIRKLEQARKFGKLGGSERKEQGQKNRKDILGAAWEIFSSSITKRSDHEFARRIAERTGLSKHTVRTHLRKARPELEALWVKAQEDNE